MTNQIPGMRLIGRVSGTGNVSLTDVVTSVSSLPISNFTVGQKFQGFIQSGEGENIQKEIGEFTYSANTPGIGVLTRDAVFQSTNANQQISFVADTTVEVFLDVPDGRSVFKWNDGTFNEQDALATALGASLVMRQDDLASTDDSKGASKVGVQDPTSQLTGTNLQAVLNEIIPLIIPATTTLAALADQANAINSTGKITHKAVLDENGRKWRALGAAATSKWRPGDGQSGHNDITPS